MAAQGRSVKPVIFVMNYIIYSIAAGAFACYWYVVNYGGSMPPSGSFSHFISDWWGLVSGTFLAPILSTIILRYWMMKKVRSNDR